jgi:hypothetical protein
MIILANPLCHDFRCTIYVDSRQTYWIVLLHIIEASGTRQEVSRFGLISLDTPILVLNRSILDKICFMRDLSCTPKITFVPRNDPFVPWTMPKICST